MDIKNFANANSIQPAGGAAKPDLTSGAGRLSSQEPMGPSFQDTLQKLQQPHLQGELKASLAPAEGLKFSNHAVERMKLRGVNFSKEQMDKLQGAVDKAAAKGSKDSLVLLGDTAVIVSVKNNTVVTVVDKNSLKDNVFTNIDSTIVT
jgi:flagellar operon protein